MAHEDYRMIHPQFDPPYGDFDASSLGSEFPRELETVSKLWFACGYRPGIGAYLNFFLLRDFIVTHDAAFPPRFQTFKSMADSFYQTDLFIRDVTDSGILPTGGISSGKVRKTLKGIMQRHRAVSIPEWMMTYFGFSLLENVEKQYGPMSADEKRWHLAYMSKAYRIMGIRFSEDRPLMERFSRSVEEAHAGPSPNLEKHAANILTLGEMVGVPSAYEVIAAMLPDKPRAVFKTVYPSAQPNLFKRSFARIAGKVLVKQAIGKPRKALPVSD